MKEIIRERIIRARLEKGITQKQLATILEKTPAAISELERGKVHISANDLYLVAKALEKPIEFFYGEDHINKDVQEIIALIKILPNDVRDMQLPVIRSFLQLEKKKNSIKNMEADNEDEIINYAKDFLGYLIKYLRSLEELRKHAIELKNEFEESLGISSRIEI